MRDFRQARYPGGDKPGRSKWPEPDSIRRLTGHHSRGHEPSHPVKGKYPRAQFGLPIIIQFKKDEDDVNLGDPSQHTLHPQISERWASPLILRPIACADGFIGLAVRLSSSLSELDGGVVLEDNQKQTHKVEWRIEKSDAEKIEPLQNQNNNTDVIAAFLDYLTK